MQVFAHTKQRLAWNNPGFELIIFTEHQAEGAPSFHFPLLYLNGQGCKVSASLLAQSVSGVGALGRVTSVLDTANHT